MTPEQWAEWSKYEIIRYWDKDAHAAGEKKGQRRRVGIKAQQVQQLLIDLYGTDNYADVVYDKFRDRKQTEDMPEWVQDFLLVKYDSFIPFLIKAAQELDTELKAEREKNSALRALLVEKGVLTQAEADSIAGEAD
jgi:hypothetical protein